MCSAIMNNRTDAMIEARLAARLHDPIEKALILMRTSEGHEGGTSATLRNELGLTSLSAGVREAVRTADHWASAADRAAFPNRNDQGQYPRWQQVRFHEQPVIIHPLTGKSFNLVKLREIEPEAVKAIALDHLRKLIHDDDLSRTALAFWRFGPELQAPELKSLWAQLPADTRVPDHSIHDHLDLTAALAGCFAADAGGPALLAVSLGPVQDFIAAARSTSDLWAGSHLPARMSWEAMRVVCERLGPEAILFPRLRGVPQVDLWLREAVGLKEDLFEDCDWTKSQSDANPLFAAALPNRFTALVPADQAREIAKEITTTVRAWVEERTKAAFRKLLEAAAIPDREDLHGYRQIEEQLAGFPEVHWAAVPWSLVGTDADGRVDASDSRLAEAMQPFFESTPPGFLGGGAWPIISGGVKLEDGWFWKPNPGTLYPALHEVLERALAASKAVRVFGQTEQSGWRDSLSGETEWLTHDEGHLQLPAGKRMSSRDKRFDPDKHVETLWARVGAERPQWAKKGEHLGALNTLKRLWPTLFVEELEDLVEQDFRRFVVSTHTMALAGSITRALERGCELTPKLREALEQTQGERVALPRRLNRMLGKHPEGRLLRKLPVWLEANREADDDGERKRREADWLLKEWLGHAPEAYYAMILMDGDRMGAWLSADTSLSLPHQDSYHPQIRAALENFREDDHFLAYAREKRSPSPSRHMAISEALNHFALELSPAVTEARHNGRILYAGGDDLMAMLPVIDLLPIMAGLRAVYSGIEPERAGAEGPLEEFEHQGGGFAYHRKRLLRLMGDDATASCGAVIAHHQTPLAAVLRELRQAEQRAKSEGDRNAFSLSIIKRSGGALRLTAKWGKPLCVLRKLCDFLAGPTVSRRAVYNSAVWLRDLPEPEGDGEMAVALLAYQLHLPGLAQDIVSTATATVEFGKRLDWIANFLSVAEFLTRESRMPGRAESKLQKEDAA